MYGIIDIGSNTIRLTIYRVEGERFEVLCSEKETAGLASFVVDGKMPLEGIHRASETLVRFRNLLDNLSVKRVSAFATASLRNVSNTDEAVQKIQSAAGIPVEVISGEEEARLDFAGAALEQVLRRDRLLSYPYESFEVFLGLLFEAAEDESVLSIRMTVYRLAEDSRVAAALLKAAGRGCEVTVLVELQARFDEERNAGWAERLRRAGCTVLYGVEGLKVHAKLLLITRRQGERLSAITQIGTGNYHERTAKQYADLSFVTADPVIGADAARFFRSLALSRPGGEYRKLVAAPKDLRARLFALIDGEIRKAEAGGAGHIILKVNSLSERGIIDRLSAASCAGVKVELIVRGVCCLLPGVAGKTENITVTSVVGRFLEHSRIYCFGDGEERRIWISSADLMGRNLFGRAELACPIEDPSLKDRLSGLLDLMLRDNVGARRLSPDGRYRPIPNAGGPPLIDCQAALAEDAAKRESKQPKPSHRTPRPGRSAPPLPPRQ